MSFDRVAPHYYWLETLVFGNQLQRARIVFIPKLERPLRVLVVGEGNGRFLAEFVRMNPRATIDCVDSSARMIALARHRLSDCQINFIQAGVAEVALPANTYDLIVTHFLFDCFAGTTLAALIGQLSTAAKREARWLVAEFFLPPRGWSRWGARALIATMYFFFRVVTGIEARRLVDHRPFLQAQGFACVQDFIAANEMVRSELWRRG